MRFQELEMSDQPRERLFWIVTLPRDLEMVLRVATAAGLVASLQRWPGLVRQAAVRTTDAWMLAEDRWYQGRLR